MNVTIVGAGNMGRGIGARLVAGGHEVEIVDRDPGQARALAEELGGPATALKAGEPFGGDVVVFALYYPEVERAATMSDVTVRDHPAELRYEARQGDQLLGEIRYRTEPGLVVLAHTEVASSAEGKGVGSELVAGALEDIRSRGLRVVPVCPFVAAYIRRHPQYDDLVAEDTATPY